MDTLINDRYLLKRLIGNGGMADVYLAEDTILGRNVALKIIRIDLVNDPISLLRFQREAKAISKMDHQNIVQVYDVGQYLNRPFIVMEYVEGKNLKQLIKKRVTLPISEAIDIMKQLTSALVHAHKNNIIHRDIKPHNVLVKDDGTAKITDFGIALNHDSMQITSSDTILGSAHYLAPELTNGEEASISSDIYALGIVFYELLTGMVPYSGTNPVQVAMSHINDELPNIRKINSDIPEYIEQIIYKACQKNKENRYTDAQEILNDLEQHTISQLSTPKLKQQSSNDLKKYTLMLSGGCLSIVVIYALFLIFTRASGVPIDKITVPNVIGKSEIEATSILKNNGLSVEINTEKIASEQFVGEVVEKVEPNIDTIVEKNSKIKLTLSNARLFEMPDFVGKNVSTVYHALLENNLNLKVNEKYVASDKESGTVLSQNYEAGKKIELTQENVIEVDIAIPHKKVKVMDVTGLTIDDAKTKLEAIGLKVTIIGKGSVLSQSIEPYSLVNENSNAEITLRGNEW